MHFIIQYAAAAAAAKSLQSCPTLRDPIDGSPPGSPVPGILHARTLEQVAISFSNAWKWKVKGKSLSQVRLLATPWTAAHQAPPSMGFSRQEWWSGVPLPSPHYYNYIYIYIYILIEYIIIIYTLLNENINHLKMLHSSIFPLLYCNLLHIFWKKNIVWELWDKHACGWNGTIALVLTTHFQIRRMWYSLAWPSLSQYAVWKDTN